MLLFVFQTQAKSLSGIIYFLSGSSPIELAIILVIYQVGNDMVTEIGICDPDGNYWIPC